MLICEFCVFCGKIFFTTKHTKDTKVLFCLRENFILCDLRGFITVWLWLIQVGFMMII